MSDAPVPPAPEEQQSERVAPNLAVARVPERVARGAFATGVMVYTGPNEFVLDFVQMIARPAQLVARVVVTPHVLDQAVRALKDNVALYQKNFGPLPAMPKPPQDRRPGVEEIYGDLKIADDMHSGAYANVLMIRHTPAEFHLDFVTGFYPHASVSARLYVAAARMQGMIDTLAGSHANWVRARTIGP